MMLHHHELRQVAHAHRAQREDEAGAHRLVLEARGSRQRRAWRRGLAKELERLLSYVAPSNRRAGTSC